MSGKRNSDFQLFENLNPPIKSIQHGSFLFRPGEIQKKHPGCRDAFTFLR
jgi:hypothetical protein